MINNWNIKNASLNTIISKYQLEIDNLLDENKGLIKQSIKYPDREEMLNEMINENNNQIKNYQKQLESLKENDEINTSVNNYIISSMDTLQNIITNKKITNGEVQLIVKKIYIHENNDEKLDIKFELYNQYNYHLDINNIVQEVTLSCDDVSTNMMVNIYEVLAPLLFK